jgi:hypothetical protein
MGSADRGGSTDRSGSPERRTRCHGDIAARRGIVPVDYEAARGDSCGPRVGVATRQLHAGTGNGVRADKSYNQTPAAADVS